ncbi:uncharacterized protein LTHEOB_4211 [Lasiodiplodia theobromae]|uniref:uncharacterized protein n=1 Tax=Lasiodiplodia theobromae TaxID=45133 RepID=UPI0015C37769|nr:uncharacterized protein LTHEOB_4211 [Lasiodiplodia theobromae]KAF4546214.1 hypothetical protein LTHEOB_4211 [Lasiodiplodia theobromae]
MYRPRTKWEWAFLSVVVLQAMAVTSLQGLLLNDYRKRIEPIISDAQSGSPIPVTVGLVAFDCFGQIAFAIDGLRSKNNIQLFTVCVCNSCIFLVAFLQYMQIHETVLTASLQLPAESADHIWQSTKPILLATLVSIGACSAALPFVTFYLHQEFAWAIYKHISADLDVRRRHLQYQLYLVSAKLCVCATASFLFIYAFVELRPTQPEFAITMLLVPVAVCKPLLAVYCIKREAAAGTAAVIILYVAEALYLLSRMAAIIGKSGQSAADDAIVLFAAAALFCAIATLAAAVRCRWNFGRGLKPLLLAHGREPGSELEFSQSELRLVRRFSMD